MQIVPHPANCPVVLSVFYSKLRMVFSGLLRPIRKTRSFSPGNFVILGRSCRELRCKSDPVPAIRIAANRYAPDSRLVLVGLFIAVSMGGCTTLQIHAPDRQAIARRRKSTKNVESHWDKFPNPAFIQHFQ